MKKLNNFVNRILGAAGFRLIRSPDPLIPFVHRIRYSETEYLFWLTDSHTKRWWHKDQQDESAEMEFIKVYCGIRDTVFDVGAHHGYQTVYMANCAALGQVHAFEANPVCALTLDANVGLNSLGNVTTNLLAIGSTSKTISIRGQSVNSESLDSWDVPMDIPGYVLHPE